MKRTKELNQIVKVIEKWVKKHKGEVIFHGGFMAFDKKSNVVEDMIIAYGNKSSIKISNDEFAKLLRKEKENFINW